MTKQEHLENLYNTALLAERDALDAGNTESLAMWNDVLTSLEHRLAECE